ncbi:hypothetical protein [Streptomyces sp. NBC_00724]|uniref:hypothetical protein n=1 Tax=Streptomyces sp. NBC_00724 TaxID=2975812 RepID=UPI002ED4AACD|nr:hypothetical protein OHB17_42670 [Streptomyces sp. NBC_00724]
MTLSAGLDRQVLRERNRCRSAGVGFILLSALALAGCTSDDAKQSDPEPPVKPTASASPTQDPETEAKTEALAAYRNFWDEQVKAYAKASIDGTQLTKYATGTALARAQTDVAALQEKGVMATGRPVSNTVVTNMNLGRKVPKATLTDCLDISGWKRVSRKTGKELPVPSKRLNRYVTVIKAEKWGTQWMILDVSPEQRTC